MPTFNLVRSFSLDIYQRDKVFKQCIRLPDGRFVALQNLDSKIPWGPTAIVFLDKSMKTVESFIPRYQIALESLLYIPRLHCILFTSSRPRKGLNLYCLDIQLHDHLGPPVLSKAGDASDFKDDSDFSDDPDYLKSDDSNNLEYFKKLKLTPVGDMTKDMINALTRRHAQRLVLHPEDGSIWFTVQSKKHIFALSPDLTTITFKLNNPVEDMDSLSFLQDGRLVVLEGSLYLRVYARSLRPQNRIKLSLPCKAACALVANKMLMVTVNNELYTIHCDNPYAKQKLRPTEKTLASIPPNPFFKYPIIDAVMQLPDSLDILATTPRQIHVFELEDVARKRYLEQIRGPDKSWFGNTDIPDDFSTEVDAFLNPLGSGSPYIPYTFDDEPRLQGGAGAASDDGGAGGAGGAEAKRMKLGNRLLHLELKM